MEGHGYVQAHQCEISSNPLSCHQRTVIIYYVNTKKDGADLETKPLAYAAHDYLMMKFMGGVPMNVRKEDLFSDFNKRIKKNGEELDASVTV